MRSILTFIITSACLSSSFAYAYVGLGLYKTNQYAGDPPPYFSISVSSNSACGEKVLMQVQIVGKTFISEQRKRIETLIEQATPKLLQHCLDAQVIRGVIAGDQPSPEEAAQGQPPQPEHFVLRREHQWRIESINDSEDQAGISFRESQYHSEGRLFIDEKGIRGRYGKWRHHELEADVVGTEGTGRYQTLLIGGYWYEFGDSNRRCAQSRNGFPYWGSFEARVQRSSNSGMITTMRKTCAHVLEPGTTTRWSWMSGGPGFLRPSSDKDTKVDAELIARIGEHQLKPEEAPEGLRDGKPLYAQNSLKVYPGKQGWCGALEVHLDFVYAMKPAKLIQHMDRNYERFLKDTLSPIVDANCPEAQSIVVREFHEDDPGAWSTLTYGSSVLLKTKRFSLDTIRLSNKAHEHLYLTNCAGCHDHGAGGAPATGLSHWPDNGPQLKALLHKAMDNSAAHVGRLQCGDCSDVLAEDMVRYMGTRQPPTSAGKMSAMQRTMKWYAERMTPEALLTSGLLPQGKLINHIYRGHFAAVSDVSAARDLFVFLIQTYDQQCGASHLPSKATYTQTERVVSEIEYTMTEDRYTLKDVVVNRVTMDDRYYEYYASIALQYRHQVKRMDDIQGGWRSFHAENRSGLIPAIKRTQLEHALARTATSRAILANAGACRAPATRQFMDNLWQFLSNPDRRNQQGDATPSRLARARN